MTTLFIVSAPADLEHEALEYLEQQAKELLAPHGDFVIAAGVDIRPASPYLLSWQTPGLTITAAVENFGQLCTLIQDPPFDQCYHRSKNRTPQEPHRGPPCTNDATPSPA